MRDLFLKKMFIFFIDGNICTIVLFLKHEVVEKGKSYMTTS